MNKKSKKFNSNLLHNKILPSNLSSSYLRIFFLTILLISLWILTQTVRIYAANQDKLQVGIAEEIIRFHVISNSDSKADQSLKYQVKDALVEALQPYLKEAKDIEEAQDILAGMLPFIEEVATKVIHETNNEYSVTASLTSCYFPMKVYGSYTFPPGYYEALQVKIGRAEGKNWWCVMFPPLCFVDETYSIVDEEGKEKLKNLLTEEEFDLLRNNKVPIKIRFRLFESIKNLFE